MSTKQSRAAGDFQIVFPCCSADGFPRLFCKHSGDDDDDVLQDHVKREAQVMMECDFPFLVNLVASFKDADRIYLLLECVMGGEFFTYLQVDDAALDASV